MKFNVKVKIEGRSALEIYGSIRELCSNGVLNPGDPLPPVRELSESLGVNRNTVSAAYQRLTKAGIAITEGRRGTRICQEKNPGEQEGVSDTALFDLADGSPRRDWLPDLNKVVAVTQLNQYLYGEAPILPHIHSYAKDWFDGAVPSDFDITLCNGAIDTIERMIAAHLIPGDKVVVEDPCYISSCNAIRQSGMQVLGAAIDEFGMRPEALRRGLEKGAKAVLVTPRAHNPTGVSVSAERAPELQKVLRDYPGVLVMEDDHFSLLAVTEHHSVIPESTYNWAIFRSVSKGLGPDLRMAFVAADKETIKRLNTRLAPGMSWVSRVLQSLVYTCLTNRMFQHQLKEAKGNCTHRRNCLLMALSEHKIDVLKTTDGLNVWVPVGEDCHAAAFALSRKGWLVRPGTSFDIERVSHALRISVQSMDEATAGKFAGDLADILYR